MQSRAQTEPIIHEQRFAIASTMQDVFLDIARWFGETGDRDDIYIDGISFDSGMGEVRVFFHGEL